MAELIVTDGIALLKFSATERLALGRHFFAFDLNRVLKASVEQSPSKDILGKKLGSKWWLFSRTGVYQNEASQALFVGPKRKRCVRVVLLSTEIEYLYLTFGEENDLHSRLRGSKRYPAGS
jgi:hypothetical protein